MKFSATLALSSIAIASAAIVPKDAANDLGSLSKREEFSHIPSKDFGKPKSWTKEQIANLLANSKFDPSQVHKDLNLTVGAAHKGFSAQSTGTSSVAVEEAAASATTGLAAAPTESATLQVFPCENPSVRKEWRNLNDGERDGFVSAIRCLMNRPSGDPNTFRGSRNRYEDFASLHQQVTPEVHEVAVFLPWHRYFLHVFEEVLRDECGYTGPMVWWNEALDAGNFQNAPMFTSRWFGSLSSSVNGQDPCVTSSGWNAYRPNLGPGTTVGNDRCLSRNLDNGASAECNQGEVDNCIYGSNNYNDYRQCSEYWVHAMGHSGVGSTMSDKYSSPEDPSFYLHHAFIDRNYKTWENNEWWNRVYEYGGNTWWGGNAATGDVMSSYGIRPSVTVADVLDTEAAYLCYVYDS